MKVQIFLVSVFLVILTGCVSAPRASEAQDSEAKKFAPPADKAQLYVARKSEMFGAFVGFKLIVDGTEVSTLSTGSYQLVVLSPGSHRFEINAGVNSASMNLDVSAGKNYFYETGAKAGNAIIQPEISLVIFEEMGKLMVSQYPRAPLTK